MFYVSSYFRHSGLYGITDTTDGVQEFYSKADALKIGRMVEVKGISGNDIQVVQAAPNVVMQNFDAFDGVVKNLINGYTEETCLEVARACGCVRACKAAGTVEEMKRILYEKLYPENVREAVTQAVKLGNSVREVNVRDKNAVRLALQNGICIVLQQGSKMNMTSFVCSGSMKVLDATYGSMFFDSVYLTKQLYSLTAGFENLRQKADREVEKKDNLLNVFSCALRFRPERKKDSQRIELSSPFYTVNLDTICGMYVITDNGSIGDTILPEFLYEPKADKSLYNFDFMMWRDVLQAVKAGRNSFRNKAKFMMYIPDGVGNANGVAVEDAMARFDDSFNYMQFLRQRGYSFV